MLIVLQRRRASIRLPRLAVDDFNHTRASSNMLTAGAPAPAVKSQPPQSTQNCGTAGAK